MRTVAVNGLRVPRIFAALSRGQLPSTGGHLTYTIQIEGRERGKNEHV